MIKFINFFKNLFKGNKNNSLPKIDDNLSVNNDDLFFNLVRNFDITEFDKLPEPTEVIKVKNDENGLLYITKKWETEHGTIVLTEIKLESELDGNDEVKSLNTKTNLQILEEQLKKALDNENYEDAIEIRDKIKNLN